MQWHIKKDIMQILKQGQTPSEVSNRDILVSFYS